MASAGHTATLAANARPRWAAWLVLRVVLRVLSLLALLLALSCLFASHAVNKLFGDERPFAAAVARGRLIVAVPSAPMPTLTVGKVDRTLRAPEPFAAALAEDLGRRAGLPVEFVLTGRAEARHAVQSGRADVAIAGLAFSPNESVAFEPSSYASGRGAALVLRHGNVRQWSDLEDRAVCVSRVSPFAETAVSRWHVRLQRFDRPLDALLAFQAGECAALVDDATVLRALLKQPDWTYYRELPGTLAPAPAFIASRGGDAASAAFLERTVNDWKRERWLASVRRDQATQLAFDMFNADNDLYCH